MTAFFGTSSNDTADSGTGELSGFTGGTLADLQDAAGDFFSGDFGTDSVNAGAGNDVIAGGEGIDSLSGGEGNDAIYGHLIFNPLGSFSPGFLYGGGGDDGLFGGNGVDLLAGGDGADFLEGGGGGDDLTGGAGADTTQGGEGDDKFYFGSVADATGDTIGGGGGFDTLHLFAVQEFAQAAGLSGIEAVNLNGAIGYFTAAQVNGGLASNLSLQGGSGLFSVAMGGEAAIDLSAYDVSSIGNGSVIVDGDGDSESIAGSGAIDTVRGRGGNDTLQGMNGNDQLFDGAGVDTLRGGAGDDTLALAPDGESDTAQGEAGASDRLSFLEATGGVSVVFGATAFAGSASGGGVGSTAFTGIESVIGSYFNDAIAGGAGGEAVSATDGNDTILGNGGNDSLYGGIGSDRIDGGAANDAILSGDSGNDVVTGGDGNDFMKGGAGGDSLDGGAGTDTIDYAASPTGVTVNLAAGTASGGDAQGDGIANVERVNGGQFNDIVIGGAAGNLFAGFNGNDVLNGFTGDDILAGNAGIDVLIGGQGKDTLVGGGGGDRFDFNAIADSTVGAERDIIADFAVNPAAGVAFVDRMNFSFIDAAASAGGNQAFTFIGSSAFTAEGQIRASQAGAGTLVQVNTTGATGAEMEVLLQQITASTLTAADFIL